MNDARIASELVKVAKELASTEDDARFRVLDKAEKAAREADRDLAKIQREIKQHESSVEDIMMRASRPSELYDRSLRLFWLLVHLGSGVYNTRKSLSK